MKPELPNTFRSGVPLREIARVEVSEQALRRMWTVIDRHAALERGVERSALRLRYATWAVAGIVVALAVAGAWMTGVPGFERAERAPAPLLLASGKPFELLEVDGGAQRVSFADGSSIEAASGTRVEGLAATEREFALLLKRGRARFSVTPGGPRRWLIETSGARVEVVGTVLEVEADTAFINVRVETGVVLVRSSALAHGVQRLEAGQSLHLPLSPRPDTQPSVAAEELAEWPLQSDEDQAMPVRARRGRIATAAELWTRIDAARSAGRVDEAARLLERAIAEYPTDSRVALAALTLGVLEVEHRQRPEAAARRFRQALELGLSPGLREGCYLRLARAQHEARDHAELRRSVAEYERLYPDGRHQAALGRLLANIDAGRDKEIRGGAEHRP